MGVQINGADTAPPNLHCPLGGRACLLLPQPLLDSGWPCQTAGSCLGTGLSTLHKALTLSINTSTSVRYDACIFHDWKIFYLCLRLLPPTTVMHPRVRRAPQLRPQVQSQLGNPDVAGNLRTQHVFPRNIPQCKQGWRS